MMCPGYKSQQNPFMYIHVVKEFESIKKVEHFVVIYSLFRMCSFLRSIASWENAIVYTTQRKDKGMSHKLT